MPVLLQLLKEDLSQTSGNVLITITYFDYIPMAIFPENQGCAIFHIHTFIANNCLEKWPATRVKYKRTNAFCTLAECLCHGVSRGLVKAALILVYNDNPTFDRERFIEFLVAPKMKQ